MGRVAPVEHRNRLLLLSVAPFPLAILATLVAVLLIGNRFPRDIAPGSSLALPGFLLSAAVLLLIALSVRRRWSEDAPRRFALVAGSVTSLLAWPVWTVALLPSVNGMRLGPASTSAMQVIDLTTSKASRSRRIYHWATLAPSGTASRIGRGRYFVLREIDEAWGPRPERAVRVVHAPGLLGVETVLDYRS